MTNVDAPGGDATPNETDGKPKAALAPTPAANGDKESVVSVETKNGEKMPNVMPNVMPNGMPNGDAAVPPEAAVPDISVPETAWPESAPVEGEEHVVSLVCGNSHLHWAFHHGVKSDVNPALFWR